MKPPGSPGRTATTETGLGLAVPGSDRARDPDDPLDLARFTSAQEGVYSRALAEIRAGDKRSHWMWFIFPQVDGLGFSSTAKHYAIKSAEESCTFKDDAAPRRGAY